MTYKKTTEKYKGKTRTYWITYKVPSKRAKEPINKAKRFYVPGEVKKTEGPGTYVNKMGNETYGIKVTYEKHRESFEAERKGTHYKVEPTTTTVTKIVELPEDAMNVQITDKEPASAMAIM